MKIYRSINKCHIGVSSYKLSSAGDVDIYSGYPGTPVISPQLVVYPPKHSPFCGISSLSLNPRKIVQQEIGAGKQEFEFDTVRQENENL